MWRCLSRLGSAPLTGTRSTLVCVVKSAPINADVLDWALNDVGMTDRELSGLAKIEAARLRSIRDGAAEPNTTEFRAIAKAIGRAPSFLFLPSRPSRAPAAAAFRASAGRQGLRSVSPSEQEALRLATRWQTIITWVRTALDEPMPSVPTLTDADNETTAVGKLGTWLAWDVDLQRTATSPSAVLRELRAHLEARGLLLLQFSLGTNSCRGFSMPGDVPVIAINSAYNPAARVYTVVHELVHVLRGDRALCSDSRDDDLERYCEQVAAAVLIPADDLREYLNSYVTTGWVESLDDARRVANRYRVSLRAAAVRLIELQRAGFSLYALIEAETDSSKSGGFNPNSEPQTTPVRRIRELGEQVPRALLRARDEGVLSDVDVRRYLDVSGTQLEDIEHRLVKLSEDV